jgi:UDPglucose 6-dehydrogenase
MSKPVIGFVGMTHLGLNSCIAAAEKGFELIGFDPSAQLISEINAGHFPVSEPQLVELAQKNKSHLSFTSDINELKKCDVVYVAPDVSTNDQGESDLTTITALLDLALEATRLECVIVVLSQVPPGFTRGKLKAGRSLYYQVETLIFGQAIHRALHPERYIIGCENPEVPIPLAFAQFLQAHDCPILPMRFESAELAKISINMCLVASVSTANTLAELCEKIGADWSEIVPALKLDRRIGQYSYLSPGLGISGGNLERDLATVCRFGDQYGTDVGVVRAWIKNSQHRKDWVLRKLYQSVLSKLDKPVIAVLGLAYKQDTHSIKNSPSIALLENLNPFAVRVFDPCVNASVISNPQAYGADSEIDAAKDADVLIVMTPWAQFKDLDLSKLASAMRHRVLIDPYAIFKAEEIGKNGFEYYTLGVSK